MKFGSNVAFYLPGETTGGSIEMEKFFYEMRPYLFLAVGLKCATAGGLPLLTASGVLLAAAAAYVIHCRFRARVRA